MAFLVIVKRDEEPLYTYLQQHFQEPEVTVLVDRRHGERRRTSDSAAEERRRTDRRQMPNDADPLWKYGFRVAPSQP